MASHTQALELQAVIGFKGEIRNGLILHPDQEHIIYPLGCTVVVRNVCQRTQTFLQGHDNDVSCLAVSPDGNLLASGQQTFMGFTAQLIVWDFNERKVLYRCNLHKVEVRALSFSPNNNYLASLGGQDDGSLVIWDMTNGQAICGLPAGNDQPRAVSFYKNDSLKLATAGNNHVTLWNVDLANKKLRATPCKLGQLKRICTNLAISEDDKFVFCGTDSGDLMKINLETGLFQHMGKNLKNYPQGITSTLILGNGDLICGTGAGLLIKFSKDDLRVIQIIQTPLQGKITSLTKVSGDTHFFCGTSESNIYWVQTDGLIAQLRSTCHFGRINAIAFPKDCHQLFVTSSCSDLRLWNAEKKQEILRIRVPNMECNALCFFPNGTLIVTGWSDGKIRAFLPESGTLAFVINDAHKNGCTSIAVTSDCKRIVSGGEEGEVRIWSINSHTQTMEASLKEHRSRVCDIQLTKDDCRAFTASTDGSCILWDLNEKNRSICLFESTQFKTICFHPDESQIITSGTDRKITYWDTFDGQAIRVLDGSATAELATLDVAKSGSHFITGSGDNTVKLWDYDIGMCSYQGLGHSGSVNSVKIAPNSEFAVSVGSEGGIFIWKIPGDVSEKMKDVSQLEV